MLSKTTPMGFTTTYTYDGDNNIASVTDANGATTTYTYDAADRVSTVTDALGGTTSYTYDAVGNQSTVTDSEGGVTVMSMTCLDVLQRLPMPEEHGLLMPMTMKAARPMRPTPSTTVPVRLMTPLASLFRKLIRTVTPGITLMIKMDDGLLRLTHWAIQQPTSMMRSAIC